MLSSSFTLVNMPILEGAWHKLRWGEAHIERLSGEVSTFLERNLGSFRLEFDGQSYLVYPAMDDPPPEWPLILGDAVHSFRGALDHLMWAMVMRTSRGRSLSERERKAIQFPLAPSVKEVEATSTFNFLDPYSRTIVLDLHRNRRWDYHPFRVLSMLSNQDKHRLILSQVVALAPGTFHLQIGHNPSVHKTTQPTVLIDVGEPLSNDAPVARFGAIFARPDGEVAVKGQVPGRVEFSAGAGVRIQSSWLTDLAELIELTLQRFDLLLQGRVPEL